MELTKAVEVMDGVLGLPYEPIAVLPYEEGSVGWL